MVLAAAAVLVPLYCDYAARVALAESLRQLAPYRDAVAENAPKEGSVEGSGVEGAIPSEVFLGLKVDYARVFTDGTIVIRHAKHRQVVIGEPSMTEEKISWRCIGGPPKGVAPECR